MTKKAHVFQPWDEFVEIVKLQKRKLANSLVLSQKVPNFVKNKKLGEGIHLYRTESQTKKLASQV